MLGSGSDHTFIVGKKTFIKKNPNAFLFILISVIYSQPGSVMNEQCVWRHRELDTTPVLGQRTNQYF